MTGVSGGPDSLCLLDMLWRLDFPVIVAHLDHGLRPGSGEEAARVEEEARARNLPFVTEQVNIHEIAEDRNLSVEEAARTARYRFLFDTARKSGAQAVVVGHHADDQVETVLMHLLRGAGLAGLGGMSYSTLIREFDESIPLVRPLLGFWREEISAYLAERHLEPVFDESNWDRRYFRNRLRHELLPELESYNPQVRRTIKRMAEGLRGDLEIIEAVIDTAWDACLISHEGEYVLFSADRLREQLVGVQRRILRRGIDLLRPGLRDIDFGAVERGIEVLNQDSNVKLDLSASLYVTLEEDCFILASTGAELPADAWPQLPPGREYQLDIPGECSLPNGWVLTAGYHEPAGDVPAEAYQNPDPFRAWMSAEAISAPLTVRSRRPGDRFYPLGMDGHSVKLSDFMINHKIPARVRDAWPLLVSGGDIIWVPGYRLGHQVQLHQGVQYVIHLELMCIQPG